MQLRSPTDGEATFSAKFATHSQEDLSHENEIANKDANTLQIHREFIVLCFSKGQQLTEEVGIEHHYVLVAMTEVAVGLVAVRSAQPALGAVLRGCYEL
jgi:hypothetical protein